MTHINTLQHAQQRIQQLEKKLAHAERTEQLFRRLMAVAAPLSGQDYFNRLVLELSDLLGAEATLIGEICGQDDSYLRTLALCVGHELQDNIEYPLCGTACEEVVKQKFCCKPANLSENVPAAHLSDLAAEGYIGVPLFDNQNTPIGVLAALFKQPPETSQTAETTLKLFAKLTSAEVLRLRETSQRNRLEKEHLAVRNRLDAKGQQLDESLMTLDAIIETLPSPIFYKNRDGIYTGCNQAFCNYLGKTRQEIVGRSVFEIAPSELAETYHRADLELMRQHGTQTYLAQVRYADGSDRDILFSKATIGDPDSEVLGLVGVMTDISDIRRAEQEMRSLRNLLHNIIDSMPSALITIDHRQQVSLWNQRAEKLTGLSAEKAVGKPVRDVLPLLTPDQVVIEQALVARKLLKISKVSRKLEDGDQFFDIMVYPLVVDDEAGAVIRIDNVSDQVQMEKVLVQSEKMMSLGGLAAGMAHEINNPLAGILQNMQVIRTRLLKDSPIGEKLAGDLGLDLGVMRKFLAERQVPEMLEAISEAGQRAAKIVQDMLSFSRQESSERIPCDLKSIIEQTLELARKDLAGGYDFRSFAVITEIPDDLPPILGIKSQLQQVLLNMLRNSAQAIFNWCELKAPPEIRISVSADSDQVTIKVADNGPGIKQENLSRIFEPFFTTKDPSYGTGLGLSVSYYIITSTHKGSLTVESTTGHGTCFNIRLPRCSIQPMYNI